MAVVGIVVHHQREQAAELARDAAAWLRERGHEVRVPLSDAAVAGLSEAASAEATFAKGLDVAVSLGGDGTMLRTVDLVAAEDVPVIGVNVGQLGYLTEVEPAGMRMALKRFLAGSYEVEERMLLALTVEAAGFEAGAEHLALNEAVLEKTPMGHTVRLGGGGDGETFTPYAADGLIVATPTGSTAYAFSARGPIVEPTHRCLLMTPVSPHMLFDRSLVLPPSATVRIEVLDDRAATLSVDGSNLGTLRPGDAIRATGAAESWVEGRFVRPGAGTGSDGHGGGDGEGDEVVLARAIPRSGRSRAYIDGRLATVGELAAVGAELVDLHGQHAHQSLLHVAAQREALDRFGGVDRGPLHAAREEVRSIVDELATMGGDERARARELDLLRYQVSEIDGAAITGPDEDAELERLEQVRERRQLLHDLRRKYGETLADVLAEGEHLRARLVELEDHDRRAAELDARLGAGRTREAEAAGGGAAAPRRRPATGRRGAVPPGGAGHAQGRRGGGGRRRGSRRRRGAAAGRQPRHAAAAAGQGGLGWRTGADHARVASRAHRRTPDPGVRRGRRRHRRRRRRGRWPLPGPPRRSPPGAGGHPPAPGGRVRRRPGAGGQAERRGGHGGAGQRARPSRAGDRAVAHAVGPARQRRRPRPRRRAVGDGGRGTGALMFRLATRGCSASLGPPPAGGVARLSLDRQSRLERRRGAPGRGRGNGPTRQNKPGGRRAPAPAQPPP